MGASIGVCWFGAILTAGFTRNVEQHPGAAALAATGKDDMLAGAMGLHTLSPDVHNIVTASYSDAMHTAFLWSLPLAVLVCLLSLALPRKRLGGHEDESMTEIDDVAMSRVRG